MPMMDLGAHSSGFRIVWADEHADVCSSVAAMLAGSFELHVASDADSVLQLVRHDPPALVCVSASLRTADGVPLLRALRALPNLERTTLMLSCPRGQEASLAQDLLACADDLVLMPLSERELSVRVQGHLRSWCARSQGADIAFLSSLGHELRTPLTAILLWSSSLRTGGNEADLERALGCIASSAQEQSRRIDDLLDLARLAAGKLVLNRGSTCMSSLLRRAWDELWPLAAAKHIVLAVELVEPIGTAEVDSGRMRQVLSNLLSNAIKFTHPGGTVRLRARRQQDALEIEVSDTGEGIAPEFMCRLFQRFQRGGAADEGRHPGLGIGLALSRQLVQLHGGSIEAHSAGVGQGATFLIRLPVPRAQEAQRVAQAAQPAGRPTLRGRTILLVEDHDETREAM